MDVYLFSLFHIIFGHSSMVTIESQQKFSSYMTRKDTGRKENASYYFISYYSIDTSNFFLLANTAFGPPVEGCKENLLFFFFFKACHSGKLKLTFTSPDVISTSSKSFLKSRIGLTVLLLFKFLKKDHLRRAS